MAGSNFIWDTNIAIDYLQQKFPLLVDNIIEAVLDRNLPIISAITEIELLCWRNPNEADIKAIKDFIEVAAVIELENDIKLKTAEIRKLHRIKLPDAIIAASALNYNLTLITRNAKDFRDIENLKLLNPWDNN